MGDREALVAAARSGLAPHHGPPVEITPDEVPQLLAHARFDRLSGFLVDAVEHGAVQMDDEAFNEARASWRATMTTATVVEALAVRTGRRLDDAGVRWRLTKGAALAHLDYPDQLAVRTFGDVDLMIHRADWDEALSALLSTGHTRPAPELRPGWDVRYGKGATVVDDLGLEIDLHLRFAIGRFGVLAEMDELFDRCDTIELAGSAIPTLNGPDRLLHACHHLVLGGFSDLRVARDVAQLLRVSGVEWEDTVETATRWGVESVVAAGIERAWARLRLEFEHPARTWAQSQIPTRADERAIEVFTTERPFRDQALTAVGALPLPSVPRYLWMLIAPTTDARRGRSLIEHVRSRIRSIRRVRGLRRS